MKKDKFENFKAKMFKKYERLPKMDATKCEQACRSGKCDFKCCTVSGCSDKEARFINKFIKKNKLDLPKTEMYIGDGYFIPSIKDGKLMSLEDIVRFSTDKKEWKNSPKCAYLGEKGCLIYEARPAICRLFGSIKQMPCELFPEEAKSDLPAKDLTNNF